MYYIDKIYTSQVQFKKSNFISFICPISEFESLKLELKRVHSKASHLVFAYRYYNDFFQIVENSSDDKEPKGSSGMPTLDALRGADLINIAALTIRYFGGIKLGVGGLVRAYFSSVNLAIKEAKLLNYEQKDECSFFVPFFLIARFEHFFESLNLTLKNKDFNSEGCFFTINITKKELNLLFEFAKNFENSGFRFNVLPLFYKTK